MIELVHKLEFRSGCGEIGNGGKQKDQHGVKNCKGQRREYFLQFYRDSLLLSFYSSLDPGIDYSLIFYSLDVNVAIQTGVDFIFKAFLRNSQELV